MDKEFYKRQLEFMCTQCDKLETKLKNAYDLLQWIVEQWDLDTKEVQDKVVKFFKDNGGIDEQ